VSGPFAEALRATQPHRVRFGAISSETPLGEQVKAAAEWARTERRPVDQTNPFLAMQESFADVMMRGLKAAGEMRDAASEALFLNFYGSPLLQSALGLNPDEQPARPALEPDPERESAIAKRNAELERRFEEGGVAEAALRALIYIKLSVGSADERGFRLLKAAAETRSALDRTSVQRFKELAREQMLLVQRDPKRAIAALPKLVAPGSAEAEKTLAALNRLLEATGVDDDLAKGRIAEIEALLGAKASQASAAKRAKG
jgi:hypothetical protein